MPPVDPVTIIIKQRVPTHKSARYPPHEFLMGPLLSLSDAGPADHTQQPEDDEDNDHKAEDSAKATRPKAVVTVVTAAAGEQQY